VNDDRAARWRQAVRSLPRSAIAACPHLIFIPQHYPESGPCRCFDSTATEMISWGYVFDIARGQWVGMVGDE
jgi:hypothetical protein